MALGMIGIFEDYPAGLRYLYPEAWFEELRIQAKTYQCTHYGVIDLSQYKVGQYFVGTDPDINYFYWQTIEEAETAMTAGGFTKWWCGSRAEIEAHSPAISDVRLESVSTWPAGDLAFIMLPDDNNLANSIMLGRETENWVSVPHDPQVSDPIHQQLLGLVFYHRYLCNSGRIV